MGKLKSKLKSYGFWSALSGAIVMLSTSVGKALGLVIDEKTVNDIIMGICEVLIVFGVVTNVPSKETEDPQTNESDIKQDIDKKES